MSTACRPDRELSVASSTPMLFATRVCRTAALVCLISKKTWKPTNNSPETILMRLTNGGTPADEFTIAPSSLDEALYEREFRPPREPRLTWRPTKMRLAGLPRGRGVPFCALGSGHLFGNCRRWVTVNTILVIDNCVERVPPCTDIVKLLRRVGSTLRLVLLDAVNKKVASNGITPGLPTYVVRHTNVSTAIDDHDEVTDLRLRCPCP